MEEKQKIILDLSKKSKTKTLTDNKKEKQQKKQQKKKENIFSRIAKTIKKAFKGFLYKISLLTSILCFAVSFYCLIMALTSDASSMSDDAYYIGIILSKYLYFIITALLFIPTTTMILHAIKKKRKKEFLICILTSSLTALFITLGFSIISFIIYCVNGVYYSAVLGTIMLVCSIPFILQTVTSSIYLIKNATFGFNPQEKTNIKRTVRRKNAKRTKRK